MVGATNTDKAVHYIQPVLVPVPQPFVRNITILDMLDPRKDQLDALQINKIRPIIILARNLSPRCNLGPMSVSPIRRMDWEQSVVEGVEGRLHKAESVNFAAQLTTSLSLLSHHSIALLSPSSATHSSPTHHHTTKHNGGVSRQYNNWKEVFLSRLTTPHTTRPCCSSTAVARWKSTSPRHPWKVEQ